MIANGNAIVAGLFCATGYAQPTPPDSADPRPWPSALPEGWSIREVYARAACEVGWCLMPSLTAAQVAPTGLVSGSIQITGPVPGSG